MRTALILLVLTGCTSQVEQFPRSNAPLGVGAQGAPPASGDDTGQDTGTGAPPEDTGTDTGGA